MPPSTGSAVRRQLIVWGILAWAGTASAVTCSAQPAPALEPPRLVIEAPETLEPVAAQIRQFDRRRLAGVMRLLGLVAPGPPITIVLADEGSPLASSTPAWIAGFATEASSTVVLFPARPPSYPDDSLEALLHHEVAHVLIGRAAHGLFVPRWFHEGLALSAERTWDLEDQARLILAMRPRPLSSLQFNASQREASLAYAVAGGFVRDLLRRAGPETAARILTGVAQGERFETAFERGAGLSLQEAEQLFWGERWWPRMVPLLTSTPMIWIGVTVLALVAIRQGWKKRRARRRAWPEEPEGETEKEMEPQPPRDANPRGTPKETPGA